jgi:hypothetical protein
MTLDRLLRLPLPYISSLQIASQLSAAGKTWTCMIIGLVAVDLGEQVGGTRRTALIDLSCAVSESLGFQWRYVGAQSS